MRAIKFSHDTREASPPSKILNLPSRRTDRIGLGTQEGLHIVRLQDIMYVESMGNYAKVHLTGGNKLMLSKTLKCLAKALPDNVFLRIHQSYMINTDYLSMVGTTAIQLDGKELPVSRSRRQTVQDWIARTITSV